MRLFIEACGVVCALGRGKAAVAESLFSGSGTAADVARNAVGDPDLNRKWDNCLTVRDDLIPGRSLLAGTVEGPLPPSPASVSELDCRNNQLLLLALDEIAEPVRAAIERYGRDRIAVVMGTSTSGIAEAETALAVLRRDGAWPPGFDYRQQEPGNIAEFAARALGLTGHAYTIATACSSCAKVFASARRLIRAGFADAAIVGGADTLCGMTANGFASLEALSQTRCNPFGAGRDGITIGEGAAAFLLTTVAAPVEFLGAGETSDAYHPTAPDPDGGGARAAMAAALADAGLVPGDIVYINLHGTGTPLNDAMEARAVVDLFGTDTPCGSTKRLTGHMLGATGGVEAAFLWLTLHPGTTQGVLPPHGWVGQPDPDLPPLRLAPAGTPVPATGRAAMLSNSFGFGGSNAALILGRA